MIPMVGQNPIIKMILMRDVKNSAIVAVSNIGLRLMQIRLCLEASDVSFLLLKQGIYTMVPT